MQLRPYQSEAIEKIREQWNGGAKRTLLVLPTGTGKTIVFCKLTEALVTEGDRVLILAHRGELLEQAADKMKKATGLGCSMEKADDTSIGEWFRVTVGSIQTLMREKRLKRFAPDHYDAIIIDEAHHVLSDSYLRVLNHFADAKVLGVTATPDRGDMRNLGEFFETLAFEYSLPQAIRDGFLVPIRAQTIPIKIELGKHDGKEYSAAFVGNALDPYLSSIASEMAVRCKGRKTVVFTPLIATSVKLKGLIQSAGMRVVEVNGESKDRAQILKDWDDGNKYDVLLNSMLLAEGWDSPMVDVIIPLRATKVRALYCQIVGRGTRVFGCDVNELGITSEERRSRIAKSSKPHLTIIDFLWHSDRLDLCRPAHLVCEDAEVADKMTERINESGAPMELDDDAVGAAEEDTVTAREEALAKMLAELQHKKAKLVDPVQYEMSIGSADLSGYKPAFGWEAEKPSSDQVESLAKLGIMPNSIDSAGKAQRIIDTVKHRKESGLSSPKSIRFLERKGFQHVGKWKQDFAQDLIGRISANRWQTPRDVDPKTYKPYGM